MYPRFAFFLSWAAVAFAALASAWWVWYVFFVDYDFLFDVVFTLFTAPVDIAVLLLAVVPSTIRYFRNGGRRDLTTLLLSGCSCFVVLVETILLWTVIKLHGA